MKAGQTSSGMVQLAGGVEHLERINPQAAPAPCPPGQAPMPCPPVDPNAPMGPPIAVHEPAPGSRDVIEVVPNQPLIFDFNPLDLKATQHQGSVVLTFPDGAQLELHDIVGPCGVQPTPFQLPDGTVITAGDLLQAFHLEAIGPCGLAQINPTAGPSPIFGLGPVNTGFAINPYDVGVIGPSVSPLGPLVPTGFGYGAEFFRGTGGSPSTPSTPGPPGPPGPPPPPTPTISGQEDGQSGIYTGAAVTGSGNYFTDTVAGHPVITYSPPAPAPHIESYAFIAGPAETPGNPAVGTFGTLTFDANALGHYSYVIGDSGAQQALVSQAGTDIMSQYIVLSAYEDTFSVTSSNDPSDSTTQNLNFSIYGADVFPDATHTVPLAAPAFQAISAGTTEILLTYTDALDPGHSFQELIQVTGVTPSVVVAPVNPNGVPIQPNDPALLSFEYVSGSAVTLSNVTVAGENVVFSGPNNALGPGGSHAITAVINPDLSGLGDPGDTGNVAGAAVSSQDSGTTLSPNGSYNDSLLSGQSGSFGYLFDSSGAIATGAGNADIVNYGGGAASNIQLTGSATADNPIGGSLAMSVIEWSSTAEISNTGGNTPGIDINGGTGGGLNVLEIESATVQNLDFTSTLASGGATPNIQNIEVFDLTDGANPSIANGAAGTGNTITLTPQDVLNLAANEAATVQAAGGGALSIWVNGTASDTVTLSGSWSVLSGPTTSGGQTNQSAITDDGSGKTIAAAGNANNNTEMVGYTEYSATVGGQTAHVYVENAIAANGHVHHA
jgi:hypothetical protein